MSITIEMSVQEITAIKHMTRCENDAEAITQAAQEFLRLIGLRQLKAASGKVEFGINWPQLESLELSESVIPQ